MAPELRCPEPRPPGTPDSRAGAGESTELQDTLPAQLTQTVPGLHLWCIVPLKTAFPESRIAAPRGRTQQALAHAMEAEIEVADGILRTPAGKLFRIMNDPEAGV